MNDIYFNTLYHDVKSNQKIQLSIQAIRVLYVDAEEDVPPNSLEPWGKPVQMNIFVEYDHVGGIITKKS